MSSEKATESAAKSVLSYFNLSSHYERKARLLPGLLCVMTLLPVGAAYQFHAELPSVILLQTQEGPDTVLRWADIIQTN